MFAFAILYSRNVPFTGVCYLLDRPMGRTISMWLSELIRIWQWFIAPREMGSDHRWGARQLQLWIKCMCAEWRCSRMEDINMVYLPPPPLSLSFCSRSASPACRPGSFKAFAGNTKCSKCPLHSSSHDQAATMCHCDKGFYRAIKDPSTLPCTS